MRNTQKYLRNVLAVCGAFFVAAAAFADTLPMPGVNGQVQISPPPGVYHTSWVGNTFGGDGGPNGFGYWVQDGVNKLVVSPDGTAICGVAYDEAGRCIGLYKDGTVNRICLQENNGGTESAWGWGTANNGVAADGQYLFLANAGNRLLRFSWTPGDLNSAKYVDEVNLRGSATGLTARNGEIAVCDSTGIELRTTSDMHVTGAFALPNVTDAVIAADGSLWILAGDTVKHYSATGQYLGQSIPSLQVPTAIAWDNVGRLIVCDDGPREQVLFYDVSQTPKLVRAFGQKGGLSSGIPGQIEPDKLFGLRGAGTDQYGNLTVAMSLTGGVGGGTFLRSFTPNGELRWDLQGMAFVDTFGFDPDSDGSTIYSRFARIDLDLNKTVPGSEWHLSAITVPYANGQKDDRLSNTSASVIVRRIQGRRILYMIGQYAGGYHLYTFTPQDGNYAQEVGHISGNDEWAWYVDASGNIWNGDAPGETIRMFKFGGWSADGTPLYDWNHPESWPWPNGWGLIRRLIYVNKTDSLYIFGYLDGQSVDSWGVVGHAARRYDGWLTGDPTVKWTVSALPVNPTGNDSSGVLTPQSVEICGDYLFVGMVKPDAGSAVYVHILSLSNGAYVGTFVPGSEIGGLTGWEDMPYAISAFERRNGEYLVLVEEDWRSKNILYRWIPNGKSAGG